MLLIKIIYKAFYKTRNRKESTKNAFVGLTTLFVTITIISSLMIGVSFIAFFQKETNFKLFLGAIMFVIGYFIYRRSSTYVDKLFKADTELGELKYSVLTCRMILISISLIAIAYVPTTIYLMAIISKF